MGSIFSERLHSISKWKAPSNWRKITTIDAHTAGEPLRIILHGLPEIKGNTILEQRRYLKETYDDIRTTLMWEPRGHADQYGCIITPPVSAEADFGVIYLHNEGYSTGCGHAIIAVTKVVLETGMLPMIIPETEVKIDSPAGLITAYARIENQKVKNVYFHNVPSFVLDLEELIEVEGIGKVKYDLAFGGAFYAFVDAESIGVGLRETDVRELIEKGKAIKQAIMKNRPIKHPFEEDLSFLYGTIFIGKPLNDGADSRNVCIFAEGEVDRCPTGTGVSARMAIHYARGEIGVNEPLVIESIIGSRFKGKVIKTTTFGSYKAVIPEVEGTAYITGKNEFYIDPDDPLKNGFLLR